MISLRTTRMLVMNDNLITELISTRISHDLIGNIGAVANAVELLDEDDLDFLDDIKLILKNSSQNLAARLKFFRMAFGLDNANLEDKKLVNITALDYLASIENKDFPFKLEFEICNPQNHKAALPMIMIMADLLIRGGKIKIYDNNNKIIASIDVRDKISNDKLNKLDSAINSDEILLDATLAPLYFLKSNSLKLSIYKDQDNINLINMVKL